MKGTISSVQNKGTGMTSIGELVELCYIVIDKLFVKPLKLIKLFTGF